MKIQAHTRLEAAVGRFEEEKYIKYVVAELTKAFGRGKVEGFVENHYVNVFYPTGSMGLVLSSRKAVDALAKLAKEDYEVRVTQAGNGVVITVEDLRAD